VPTPVPAPTPTPTVVPATDDIAEQRKQDKAADEAKTVSPATINEAIINEAIAQILTAMKANNCASQAWVMSQIRAAVPEPIRTMGAQARIYYGNYLKLEPTTGANVSRTAVWGKLDEVTSGVPPVPDDINDYVLMSIAGVVQWVQTEEFACPI
jgi:hypothetical protein